MIELFGYQIDMTWAGMTLLVGMAVVIGLAGQWFGSVRISLEWLPDAVAAFIGGFIGSEGLGTLSASGPEWEGVFIVPALLGAVVLALIVDAIVRLSTGGSFTGHARPA